MKAVFMGTPDFAVPVLQAMIDEGLEVAAVVTQPDKAKGRGNKIIFSPVKETAVAAGIRCCSPSGSGKMKLLLRRSVRSLRM